SSVTENDLEREHPRPTTTNFFGSHLVYVDGQLCDPFHGGEAIGSDEAAALVSYALGGAPRLDRSWLEAVPDHLIVERMLRNLNDAYRRSGDLEHWDWIAACLTALGVGPAE
ncbi:MAG: hypothetical protein P1T08_12025, partial [Acidimicrobiia bacterium]|nr:hypothetical protein [Acidimicrobiia bacterium]